MTDQLTYCCIHLECKRVLLTPVVDGLSCANGHFYSFAPGTDVPVFAKESEDANEYARHNAAEFHDNALRWVFSTFGTDEATLRESLIARLHLKPGCRVLVTGAGAGNDLPHLVRSLQGTGQIFAQDLAQEMLLAGVSRHRAELGDSGVELHFSVSDAADLPFVDAYFDAAYHFGGINLFADIRKGIEEMNRVVKPGGKIVIGDEGVAPWLRNTEYGKMLIRNNRLYACEIPLAWLPESARCVQLSWELCNCFYVLEFTVAHEPLAINMDVAHVGMRGGSIKTRYFGQLEGIDPVMRDRIYSEAERLGLSRVDYLESILLSALPKTQDRDSR